MSLQQWTLIVQIIVAVILAVTAIFILKAAKAAKRSAEATEKSAKNTQAMVRMQTFAQLLDAYSSSKMLEDMLTLIEWKEKHLDWTAKYGQMMKDKDERKKVIKVHEARRHYAHHFYKIRLMYESNFLDKNLLNKLATPGQIEFLLDTVEPLEKQLEPPYDDSTYRFFENLRKEFLAYNRRIKL